MNVELEIKRQILIDANKDSYEEGFEIPKDADLIEFYSDEMYEKERCSIIDAEMEFRDSGIDIDLECPDSRHYESQQVARKLDNGVWVSWTYWYGGGKHGDPEAMEWIGYAYFVECKEEVKTITVQEFTKI